MANCARLLGNDSGSLPPVKSKHSADRVEVQDDIKKHGDQTEGKVADLDELHSRYRSYMSQAPGKIGNQRESLFPEHGHRQ